MSDATLLLKVEAKKKSGWLAAFLNLLLPGAGHIYCGRWVPAIIVFLFYVVVVIATIRLGTIPFSLALIIGLVLVVDGFLAASRYNKKLIQSVLAEEEAKEKNRQPDPLKP